MRIFFFDTDKKVNPLTLLHESYRPSRHLNFPGEIIQKIIDYLPRSSLLSVAQINQQWYSFAMRQLYKHIYIRTYVHWLSLVRTFSNTEFAEQFGPHIQSIVLKPSPRLISAQLTSHLNQIVVQNDDKLQPYLRGYVRLERVDYNLTGLEGLVVPEDEDSAEENSKEMDTAEKEAEWLSHVEDSQIVPVLRYASQLEYLYVCGCENLGDSVLTTLAKAKRQQNDRKPIVGLWMSLLRHCTPSGICQLITVERELKLEKKLKYLDIGFQQHMTDDCIQDITSYWGHSLTHIRVNSIYQLSDASIVSLTQNCPDLRLLHLIRCWNIHNASLKHLAKHCKKLKFLSISFLSSTDERGIQYLVQLLPELTWMDITGCSINPLFKSMIIEGWKNYRLEQHLPPIHFDEDSLNLL